MIDVQSVRRKYHESGKFLLSSLGENEGGVDGIRWVDPVLLAEYVCVGHLQITILDFKVEG